MSEIRFVGLDPSMSNLGLVFGTYRTDDSQLRLLDAGLVQTADSKQKTVRKSSRDYDRFRALHSGMHEYLSRWEPNICFAEMPTGSQSASGMKSYGASIMLLATIPVPVVQLTPMDVKSAAVGDKKASKEAMINWACATYPHLPWLTWMVKGVPTLLNKNEHIADAVGAVAAGLKSDQWRQLVSMMRTANGQYEARTQHDF